MLPRRWVITTIPFLLATTVPETDFQSQVDQAARRFRICVYETFRTDRTEFDRRIEVSDQLLRRWEEQGRPERHVGELLEWFELATDASQTRGTRELPDPPGLGRQHGVQAHSTQSPDARPTKVEPARIAGSTPGIESSIGPIARPKLNLDRNQLTGPPRSPDEPDLTRDGLKEIPRTLSRPARPTYTPDGDLPRLRLDDGPPYRTARDVQSTQPRESFPTVRYRVAPGREEVSESVSALTQPLPAMDLDPRWQEVASDTHAVASGRSSDLPIDLNVLAAKIKSHNLRVGAIESELSVADSWDVTRLRGIVARLQHLIEEREHILIYYRIVPDEYRGQVESLAGPNAALALMAQRMFEVRISYANRPGTNDQLENDRWFEAMNEISTRLRVWTSELRETKE